jgi:hypothetical protein
MLHDLVRHGMHDGGGFRLEFPNKAALSPDLVSRWAIRIEHPYVVDNPVALLDQPVSSFRKFVDPTDQVFASLAPKQERLEGIKEARDVWNLGRQASAWTKLEIGQPPQLRCYVRLKPRPKRGNPPDRLVLGCGHASDVLFDYRLDQGILPR